MRIERLFFWFCLLLFGFQVSAQNVGWELLEDERSLSGKELFERDNAPSNYLMYQTDYHQLVQQLELAPNENEISSPEQGLRVNLPSIDGDVSSFYVYYSAISEEEMQNGFTETRSYKGVDTKNPGNVVHLVAGDYFGLSLSGYNLEGDLYFVQALSKDLNTYMSYYYKDVPKQHFECGVTSDMIPGMELPAIDTYSQTQPLMSDSTFRTYRLALACTPEYAAYHVAQAGVGAGTDAQKKQAVRQAFNAAVSILNTLFERDMSLRFVLVANTNNLIYLNGGNYNDSDTGQMITQNQTNINNVIGSNDYDIGHVFGFGSGGGLAALSSLCVSNIKAQGASGTEAPEGPSFVIGIVAHEIGHQLGATHTFSVNEELEVEDPDDPNGGSCIGNMETDAPTQVEVGSGITIMAYTGLCAPYDYDVEPYAFFHYASLAQMKLVVAGADCGDPIASGNPAPNIAPITPKRIPHSTPFVLTAEATDTNNPNTLTYSWEQIDPALTIEIIEEGDEEIEVEHMAEQPPVATSETGPNFRLYNFTARNYRSFPSTDVVLDGSTIENEGVVGSEWEVLSNLPNRIYTFGVVVRDNNPMNGGQTRNSLPAVVETRDAGPFVITYPNNIQETGQVEWYANQSQTITWDVAGTDANEINTTHVKISYTTNNGATWTPFEGGVSPTIPGSFPNNGSATITAPELDNTTSAFRVKIEAIGNIYYTVSKRVRMYGKNVSTPAFELADFKLYPNPTSDIITVSFTSETTQDVVIKLYDYTGREVQTHVVNNNGQVEKTIDLSQLSTGVYIMNIKDGHQTMSKQVMKK